MSKKVVPFLPFGIKLTQKLTKHGQFTGKVRHLIRYAFYSFKNTLQSALNRQEIEAYTFGRRQRSKEVSQRTMKISINMETNEDSLTLETDESYKLKVKAYARTIQVKRKTDL